MWSGIYIVILGKFQTEFKKKENNIPIFKKTST